MTPVMLNHSSPTPKEKESWKGGVSSKMTCRICLAPCPSLDLLASLGPSLAATAGSSDVTLSLRWESPDGARATVRGVGDVGDDSA